MQREQRKKEKKKVKKKETEKQVRLTERGPVEDRRETEARERRAKNMKNQVRCSRVVPAEVEEGEAPGWVGAGPAAASLMLWLGC
eukprot:Skav211610  [mRNA]  locus=scaffold3083:94006:94831:- [translate_table: standard]